ncbi:MAG TPA: hypothetical protein V6C88_13045 [Chroococcidiopsis sp.]
MSNSADSNPASKKRFLSLQTKIWIGFTLIFTPVFAGSYYWFYQYTTTRVLQSITTNLANTIEGTVKTIDLDDFEKLYQEESASNPQCPPAANAPDEQNGYYPDNPLYWAHVNWLGTIQKIEPKVRIYTYIKGIAPREIIAIGSTGALRNPRGGFRFCERYTSPDTPIYDGLSQQVNVWEPYKDDFGYWITTYMPMRNVDGKIVGAIGMDIPADYVDTVRRGILVSGSIAFVITYIGIFVLIYVASRMFTKSIVSLAHAAEQIGEGNYEQDFSKIHNSGSLRDEIDTLISVFQIMVVKVFEREQNLRQTIQTLSIEIDEVKRQQRVQEIVDTDFFHDLQMKAQNFRKRRNTPKTLEGLGDSVEGLARDSLGAIGESTPSYGAGAIDELGVNGPAALNDGLDKPTEPKPIEPTPMEAKPGAEDA